ncbi:MAG: hypothetical protein ACFFC7_29095 [Candidatus Hermodarchaeota archaeon]
MDETLHKKLEDNKQWIDWLLAQLKLPNSFRKLSDIEARIIIGHATYLRDFSVGKTILREDDYVFGALQQILWSLKDSYFEIVKKKINQLDFLLTQLDLLNQATRLLFEDFPPVHEFSLKAQAEVSLFLKNPVVDTGLIPGLAKWKLKKALQEKNVSNLVNYPPSVDKWIKNILDFFNQGIKQEGQILRLLERVNEVKMYIANIIYEEMNQIGSTLHQIRRKVNDFAKTPFVAAFTMFRRVTPEVTESFWKASIGEKITFKDENNLKMLLKEDLIKIEKIKLTNAAKALFQRKKVSVYTKIVPEDQRYCFEATPEMIHLNHSCMAGFLLLKKGVRKIDLNQNTITVNDEILETIPFLKNTRVKHEKLPEIIRRLNQLGIMKEVSKSSYDLHPQAKGMWKYMQTGKKKHLSSSAFLLLRLQLAKVKFKPGSLIPTETIENASDVARKAYGLIDLILETRRYVSREHLEKFLLIDAKLLGTDSYDKLVQRINEKEIRKISLPVRSVF